MDLNITPEGWLAGRGDYGADNAADLIGWIEDRNCALGCTLAGSRQLRRDVGPGGSCPHLLAFFLEDRVTGFEHDGGTTPDGHAAPLCTNRVPPPAPVRRGHRRRQATLFDA